MTRRLSKLDVETLDDDQRSLYRDVVSGPRGRGRGPGEENAPS